MNSIEIYDELHFARVALSGLTNLLAGQDIPVDPEEIAVLLEPIEARIRKVCEGLKDAEHV